MVVFLIISPRYRLVCTGVPPPKVCPCGDLTGSGRDLVLRCLGPGFTVLALGPGFRPIIIIIIIIITNKLIVNIFPLLLFLFSPGL